MDETSEAVLRQREIYLQEIRKVLTRESDRIGQHLIHLGLFQHEPPEDEQLLQRVLQTAASSRLKQENLPFRAMPTYRPHSYSDSDLKETRQRQIRKKMLRRKDSTNSILPRQASSKSLPSSPLVGTDQRRSVSDIMSRSGGVLAQPVVDQAEVPLLETQLNRELMFLDGLILDPKRLFGRRHSLVSVRKRNTFWIVNHRTQWY